VVFPSDAVSRLHAQLQFDNEKWIFRDLNSRNGSFLTSSALDGTEPRLKARVIGENVDHPVAVGETILLGNGESRLTFLAAAPEVLSSMTDGTSAATHRLERAISVCAEHRLPVFLLGPSGSGKTHVARAIHERARTDGNFVLLNCGRLPHDPAQLASELLGHVKGSFTGAIGDRIGKLWSADGGTLFLDEVESLGPAAQDFLLDVLEGSGNFSPYGAPHEARRLPPRFRLVSASKAPLRQSSLRPDLCQRLAGGDIIVLPTLHERTDDIPSLVDAFLEQLRIEQRLDAALSPDARKLLQSVPWPGEIRELQSTVKVVVSREHARNQLDGVAPGRIVVGVTAFRDYLTERAAGFGSQTARREREPKTQQRKRPADLTIDELRHALELHGGNKTRAAASLGIAVNTLKTRLKEGA